MIITLSKASLSTGQVVVLCSGDPQALQWRIAEVEAFGVALLLPLAAACIGP